MSGLIPDAAKSALSRAARDGNLTLYLGAGVSVGSLLPTWEKLLLTVYFERMSEIKLEKVRPFPNYLFAIADWYLKEQREPPELLARKLRALFEAEEEGQAAFIDAIGRALYGYEYGDPYGGRPDTYDNKTLQAVVDLCALKAGDVHAVKSVISYNYDDLLEQAMDERHDVERLCQPVYSEAGVKDGNMPIFHVHGYLPFQQLDDAEPSVVLSEQEFNAAASDPYAWHNLVQLREMSSSVGLMVGLSISDRNIRRLLDVLRQSPIRPTIYALMRQPKPIEATSEQIDAIDEEAVKLVRAYQDAGQKSRQVAEGRAFDEAGTSFNSAGTKGEAVYQRQIRMILSAVDTLNREQELKVMESLGIIPIWYESHSQIPAIIEELCNA